MRPYHAAEALAHIGDGSAGTGATLQHCARGNVGGGGDQVRVKAHTSGGRSGCPGGDGRALGEWVGDGGDHAAPAWLITTEAGRVERAPVPPSGQQQLAMPMLAPASGQRTRGGLSMEQLMGLLNVEFDCMLEQMDREHQAAQQRARQEFDAFRQRAMRVWGAMEVSA